ncbi:hypothetical protein N8500_03040 [Candidatus Puniceispirillum sp.]|nr:hypothetical protein [Candidatus Puniceispirillum sp.]
MIQSNSVKTADGTAPQSLEMTGSTPSLTVRHLGLIKAMAIVMAVLIVATLSVIVVTIYSRLTDANVVRSIQQNKLVIPFNSRVTSASYGHKGEMLLVIDDKVGQQLWKVGPAGKIRQKTRIAQTP